MQQQMAQQHEQIGQQAMSQQMVLCPVRFVYETQILVQPGDQIQPNQTFFINPQNPPPWMQNSLQSRQPVSSSPVVYVQQLPNNIVPSVQPHMDQNQLYLQQNFGNFIQQPMIAPQEMRPSMQLANIVPNMVQNIQTHVVNDNRAVTNQMQNQIMQNQVVRPVQNQMMNQVDQRQVFMRPQMQQTNIIRPMMNPMQSVQQQNLALPNVASNTGQTFVPNLGRPPNGPKTSISNNVVSVQPVVPKIRELSPAEASKASNSPIGNVVPSVRSFVPNYYRPIQPRPQMTQSQNVGPNMVNSPKVQQHIPVQTLQNTPVYNHEKPQSSNSNSAIIQQLNIPIRKRKSESPDDIHRKMTPKPNYNQQGVAKPNFSQQSVTVTKLVNEIGTNTSPVHRPKLNPQLQINPQPINKNVDESKETNLQDKDKLVRNTVFTQARVGRVLQDKVDEIKPIVQNTEPKVEKCEVQLQTDIEMKHKPDNIRLVQEYTKYVNNLPDNARNMQDANVQSNVINMQQNIANMHQSPVHVAQNANMQGQIVNIQRHPTNMQAYAPPLQQNATNMPQNIQIQGGVNLQSHFSNNQQNSAQVNPTIGQQVATNVQQNATHIQTFVPNIQQSPVQQNVSNVQGYPTNMQINATNMQQNTTSTAQNTASVQPTTANIQPYATNMQRNAQNMQQNAASMQQNVVNAQQQNVPASQNTSNNQQNIEKQNISQTEAPTQNTANVQTNIKTNENISTETITKPKTEIKNTKASIKIQDSEFKKPKNVEPKTEKVVEKEKAKIVERDESTTKIVEEKKLVEVKEEQSAENEKISIKQENINILTHVVDGYVIQESNFAFPIRKPLKEKTIPSNMKSESHDTRDLIRESIKEELKSNLDIPLLPFHYLLLESAKEEKEKAEAMEIAEQKEKNNPFSKLQHTTVKSWTVEDLTTHLLEFNWKDTVSLLQEHEIDGESLYLVSKPQLLTIGVPEDHADVICDFVKS